MAEVLIPKRPFKKFKNGVYVEYWSDQAYTTKYWIIVADNLTDPEVVKEFKKITGGAQYEVDSSYEAFTHQFHNSKHGINIMMGFNSKATYNAIAHECKHALNRTFKHHGMDLDPLNDEHECYYLGYLLDKGIEAVLSYHKRCSKPNEKARQEKPKGRATRTKRS